MSDEIDRASGLEEKHRTQALLLRKPQLIPCGFCFNCGESVHPGHLFCDKDCHMDFVSIQEAKRRR